MAGVLPADRLVVGMQLPIQSKSPTFVEPWEAHAGAPELATIARAADEAGFFYVGVCDHVAIPSEQAGAMGTEWWDTVATLGWLAGITERVRLLSHIYVPAYRHPLQVAKSFATLDAISGGRVIMGVGAGHVEAEFELLGLPFADRGKLLDESIDAVRAAFAEDYPTLPGPVWPAADLGQHPRPVQEDGPPIWVGGSSPAALRRAAQRGDGWLPQGPVTPEIIATITALRAAVDVPIGVSTGAWFLPDPADRLRAIEGWTVLPDFASVNLHESGADHVAGLLLDRGVGVEAGVWHADGARLLVEGGAEHVLRILYEPMVQDVDAAHRTVDEIDAVLEGIDAPRLLHGYEVTAWAMLRRAGAEGFDTRVGFEDTLTLPDGSPASSNADLVRAALEVLSGS